jgi:hypothetical protein
MRTTVSSTVQLDAHPRLIVGALVRARILLRRVLTLLAEWSRTGAEPGAASVWDVRGNLVVTVRTAGLNRRLVLSRRLRSIL